MSNLNNANPFIIQPATTFLQRHPYLKHQKTDLAVKYMANTVVTEEMLQTMGRSLWTALVQDEPSLPTVFAQAREAAGEGYLPIIIQSNQADIQQLPWETLHHPEYGFLGRETSFTLSRHSHSTRSKPAITSGPLRVLLFTALPDDLDAVSGRFDAEQQQALILQELFEPISQGIIDLKMPDDGRFSTLETLLKEFQPHLLFMLGHGKFYGDPHLKQPYATFQFENEHGYSEFVRDEKLAQLFHGSSVMCTVLAACESGQGSSEALQHGLAWQLHQAGVPHVIGMRESILATAAIQFNQAFCTALATQTRVDVAIQQARQVILTPLKANRSTVVGEWAELSLGQWCLPSLLSDDVSQPLISWQFDPKPPRYVKSQELLDKVSLPDHFVGRRTELRRLMPHLHEGHLLITGAGGQGKTSLAGKLAQNWQQQQQGRILAWSARPESGLTWEAFVRDLPLLLNKEQAERYNDDLPHCETEEARATLLLQLLLTQEKQGLLLFLDNLESLQDKQSRSLIEPQLQAWLNATQTLAAQGLRLLLTSRWKLPTWDKHYHPLTKPTFGDFLQMALYQRLPSNFHKGGTWLGKLYETLNGNGRGLQFFVAATAGYSLLEEEAFLQKLATVEGELQLDMGIEAVVSHLTSDERALLERLPAYLTSVPVEGIIRLGGDLPNPDHLLQRLVDRSLVEQYDVPAWAATEYQLSPLVNQWLKVTPTPELWQTAAAYQAYLFEQERRTLPQAMALYRAWQQAGEQEKADRLVLDYIIGPLNRAGFYRTLLEEWLPDPANSSNPQIKGEALSQIGKQYLHIGDYKSALGYLQQALTIQRAIGDKEGEATALNNISQIYDARGDYKSALGHLQQALTIWQAIGDKEGEGRTLNNISQIYDARGDYKSALGYLQQALTIQRAIGDKEGEGRTLNNMAIAAHAQGDYETALGYLQQALTIQRAIGDKEGEGTTLNNMATAAHAQSDYDTALGYLQQALTIQRAISDKAGEGTTLNNISQVYDARGDYETALATLQQALAIRQDIGDKEGEGATLNNMATAALARGDYESALGYLQQALTICQAIGDKEGEGATLNNISQIYDARGDYESALGYLQQALTIQRAIGDEAGLCGTLFNMGFIHMENGQQNKAVRAWVAAYRLANRMGLARVLQALEQLAVQFGRPEGLAFWAALAAQMEE